jgi:hypothetical protein
MNAKKNLIGLVLILSIIVAITGYGGRVGLVPQAAAEPQQTNVFSPPNVAGAWNKPSNWSEGHVPTAGEDAEVPFGKETELPGHGQAGTCRNLEVGGAVSGTSEWGFLDVKGNLDNGGIIGGRDGTPDRPIGGAIKVTVSGNITNDGTIQGGDGETDPRGWGGHGGKVDVQVFGDVTNNGTIRGGDGADGDPPGNGGKVNLTIHGDTFTNNGTIRGGNGGTAVDGSGEDGGTGGGVDIWAEGEVKWNGEPPKAGNGGGGDGAGNGGPQNPVTVSHGKVKWDPPLYFGHGGEGGPDGGSGGDGSDFVFYGRAMTWTVGYLQGGRGGTGHPPGADGRDGSIRLSMRDRAVIDTGTGMKGRDFVANIADGGVMVISGTVEATHNVTITVAPGGGGVLDLRGTAVISAGVGIAIRADAILLSPGANLHAPAVTTSGGTSDYGVEVVGEYDRVTRPGLTTTVTYLVINMSNVTETIGVQASDSLGWLTGTTTLSVTSMPPGSDAFITMTVSVPLTATRYARDVITVTASCTTLVCTDTASLSVWAEPAPIYLPLVLKEDG